jgi:hypothetical protein
MSDYPQPGLHPDPDSLNAFIEGVLPEHERQECLAHLADCADCRDVVYLAEEHLPEHPVPVAVTDKVSVWKRSFRPIPALTAGAVAALVMLSIALYRHDKPPASEPVLVAMAPRAAEPLSPPATVPPPAPVTRPAPKRTREAPNAMPPAAASNPTVISATPSISVPAPAPLPAQSLPLSGRAGPLIEVQPSAPVAIEASNASIIGLTGIAGAVTDPSGAVISGATVTLRQLGRTASRNIATVSKGQFNAAGLEPGRYELQVSVPGFQTLRKQVDVQPEVMARADSTLSIGSVSEAVNVEASVAMVNTESAARTALPSNALPSNKSAIRSLPNKLPTETSVVKGKLMLATDTAGALFLSQNAGKKWKAVKPVWQGKVVSLETLSTSGPVFQLTTGSGAVWLSRDGSHWYAAPAPR